MIIDHDIINPDYDYIIILIIMIMIWIILNHESSPNRRCQEREKNEEKRGPDQMSKATLKSNDKTFGTSLTHNR